MTIDTLKEISTKIKPTEVYNEGWMTRLLVYYSIEEKLVLKNKEKVIIDFSKIQNWTSEALISSPFVKAKAIREGYTHADIALGDFTVKYKKKGEKEEKGRGKLTVKDNANNFGIIEAKMASPLSKKTSNTEDYNQAARNVACIAYNTYELSCKTFFYVVAPQSKLKLNKKNVNIIIDLVDSEKIVKCIDKRIEDHNVKNTNDEDKIKNKQDLIDQASNCEVGVISYETWIEQIQDENTKAELNEFYTKCKNWNNIKDA